MIFQNKNILIISPNQWGELHISKHHYAIELVKRKNIVYFLNPPQKKLKNLIEIKETNYKNLYQINYKPYFNFKIRFHFRFLFDFLMKFQIKKILKLIDSEIDIVWCFEFNLFSDLKLFNAKYSIYHPVDPVNYKYQINPAKTADIVLSVSENILSKFKNIKTNKFLINHGLNNNFKSFAEKRILENQYKKADKIRVGYIGNLTRPIIDKNRFINLIDNNKSIEFHFWGPYSNNNNLSGDEDNEPYFIEYLKTKENVFLHGNKTKQELILEIKDIDIFILFYIEDKLTSDRSNSHKIIEYLATGIVVFSNEISHYKSFNDLILMSDNDFEINNLFKKIIDNLEFYNSKEFMEKRIDFALDNTYEKQIVRIERIINKNLNV